MAKSAHIIQDSNLQLLSIYIPSSSRLSPTDYHSLSSLAPHHCSFIYQRLVPNREWHLDTACLVLHHPKQQNVSQDHKQPCPLISIPNIYPSSIHYQSSIYPPLSHPLSILHPSILHLSINPPSILLVSSSHHQSITNSSSIDSYTLNPHFICPPYLYSS